jgi:hypothetical protein
MFMEWNPYEPIDEYDGNNPYKDGDEPVDGYDDDNTYRDSDEKGEWTV